MPRILILDEMAPQGLALLEAETDFSYHVHTGLAGDELRQALSEYDGAICRSGVTIDADQLANNSVLKAIVRAGVGTDNVDKLAATRAGIVVMNTPSGNTFSTAEHTFTLMLAMSRNVAPAYQSLLDGQWDRSSHTGSQLAGKTLGIIGLGRIGQEVASRAIAFQMKIVGMDPFFNQDQADKLGIQLVDSLDDLLPQADYLTVHTPLTKATLGLIGSEELAKLKTGARVINCARGGIYDEEALADALEAGQLAGAALDVFAQEPCTDSRLFGMPGVLCTPHLGASTEEAQTQVAIEAAQLLIDFFKTGEIRHAVNMSPIDSTTLTALSGYINMAYRLGLFLSQWAEGRADACRLEYRGDIAARDTDLISASVAAGVLEQAMSDNVNIINSRVLLKERGIQLAEQHQVDMGAFSSSLTTQLACGDESYTVAGTLFGNNMPRLIRIGSYRLETYLDGVMLVFRHHDVPGIIGSVGTILGQQNVNIAQMSVGRSGPAPGGEAIGVLNLDCVPPEAAVEAVRQHEGIQRVQIIQLPAAGEMPPWLNV